MNIELENLVNKKIAIVMVGLPGSGKSTWINEFRRVNADRDFAVISSDNILENIALERGLTYSDVYDEFIDRAVNEMKASFRYVIGKGESFIWDQTNMTVKKRRSILSQVPKDYYRVAVAFDINRDELDYRLKVRAEATGKWIPNHVIDTMCLSYQKPSLEEGFDKIIEVRG